MNLYLLMTKNPKSTFAILLASILLIIGLTWAASTNKLPFISKEIFFGGNKSFSTRTTDLSPEKDTFSYQKITTVALRNQYDFAGEAVPMDDWDVRERLERELLVNIHWHSNTLQLLKLSHRYFPEIEKELKRNGVPEDFKYLALAESGFRNVISPSRAVGYWQFLKETGIKYGLSINDYVDQRYDYAQSTTAACGYLKEAYKRFGSWTMAAASYNMGIGGLSSESNFQRTNNYYELWLNSETSRYLFRLIALKEICEHPAQYGYFLSSEDLYDPIPYSVVVVDSSITDLVGFAQNYGTTYKKIKSLNPWILGRSLQNKEKRTFEIRIPEETAK